MIKLNIFILFTFILTLSLGFDCSSLTNQTFCEAYGCTFTNQACTGTFTPTCTGKCYYVEANPLVSPGSGTLASPYANIKQAFTKLSSVQVDSGVFSIIILSKSENDEFNLTGTFTYNAQMKVSIRPYVEIGRPTIFVGQLSMLLTKLTFSMENLRFSTRSTDYDAVKEITLTLLIECNITNIKFEDFYANKNDLNYGFLHFSSVNPLLSNIHANNAPGFQIGGDLISIFTMTNLTISNTQFKQYFLLLEVQQFIGSNLTFLNITQNFSTQGNGLFQVLPSNYSSTQDTFVKYQNVFVKDFTGLLMSHSIVGTDDIISSLYHLSNFTVQNANASTQYLLFNFQDASNITISDSSFQGITNVITFLNIKNVQNFTVKNTKISNIKAYQFEEIDSLYNLMETARTGSCIMLEDSHLYLIDTNFSLLDYNCVSFNQANFTFDGVTVDYEGSKISPLPAFINTESVGPIMTLHNVLNGKISNSYFLNNNQFLSQQGSGILIEGEDTSPVLFIQGTNFSGLKAQRGAAIYSNTPFLDLKIDGCKFQDNEAIIEGGAIYLNSGSWTSSLEVKITGSKFKGNIAGEKGGAVMAKDLMLEVNNCKFVENAAENGGAIFGIINKTSSAGSDMMIALQNNYFSKNEAENVGGAIRLKVPENLMKITGNTFLGNIAEKSPSNNDILTENPTSVRVNLYKITKYFDKSDIVNTNSFVRKLKKNNDLVLVASSVDVNELMIPHKTGQSLQYVIEVQCLGDDNQVFQAVNGDQLRMYFNSSQSDYYTRGDVEFSFSQGVVYIYNQIQLFGNLHTKEIIFLSPISGRLPNLDGVLDFTVKFTIEFIDCEVGEIYQKDFKTCSICEAGSVSFGDPYKTKSCTLCLEGTYECLGGAMVSVNQGYWRSEKDSLDVYECRVGPACLGGVYEDEYSPYGHCDENYQGNLCNACVKGYAKADSFKCSDCSDNVGNYIRFLVYSGLQVLFMCFVIKFYLSQSKAIMENITNEKTIRDSSVNGLNKILISFMQTLCILSNMDLQWPLTFSGISTPISQVVPSDKNSFTIDCFIETSTLKFSCKIAQIIILAFGREHNPIFVKFAIFALRPLISSALMTIFILRPLILQWKKTKLKELKYKLVAVFALIGFVMQPGIMQMGIEIFKCVDLDSKASYMYLDLDLECGSQIFQEGTRTLVWPLFIIWTNILPVLLILATFKKFKNRDKTFNSQYFWLFAGYKRSYFFWEYWVYFRKMFLIILTILTYTIPSQIRVWLILFLLTIMLMAQLVVHPFEAKVHNDFEALSLFCLCLIVGSQMYIVRGGYGEDNDGKITALIVLGTIVLLAFVLRYLWLIISTLRNKGYQHDIAKIVPLNEQEESPREKLNPIKEDRNEEKRIKTDPNERGYRRIRVTSKTSEDFTNQMEMWRGPESTRELKAETPRDGMLNSPRTLLTERETLSTQRGLITDRDNH